MPLFNFLCKSCEADNEILVRGSEKPTCPTCGSTQLVKQAAAVAVKTTGKRREVAPIQASGGGHCCGGGCGCH
jgi:putative FmdB family regulatory protein